MAEGSRGRARPATCDGGGSGPPAFPSAARPGARACPPPCRRPPEQSWAHGLGPHGVAVAGHGRPRTPASPTPGASRSSVRRTSARSRTGANRPSLATLACGQRPHLVGHCFLASQDDDVHRCTSFRHRRVGLLPSRAADRFDACGSRPADLVFVPTLACGGVGGRSPAAERGGHRRGPATAMTARLAPSPPGTESRRPDGQGLPLSRTMLSNHELPYVGRFACDWLRLATTDPDATHTASVRPRLEVSGGKRRPVPAYGARCRRTADGRVAAVRRCRSGAGLPGAQVLLLGRGQPVDGDPHGLELQPGDLGVDVRGARRRRGARASPRWPSPTPPPGPGWRSSCPSRRRGGPSAALRLTSRPSAMTRTRLPRTANSSTIGSHVAALALGQLGPGPTRSISMSK